MHLSVRHLSNGLPHRLAWQTPLATFAVGGARARIYGRYVTLFIKAEFDLECRLSLYDWKAGGPALVSSTLQIQPVDVCDPISDTLEARDRSDDLHIGAICRSSRVEKIKQPVKFVHHRRTQAAESRRLFFNAARDPKTELVVPRQCSVWPSFVATRHLFLLRQLSSLYH